MTLDGSKVDALCHSSEVSDRKLGSLKAAFTPGEAVKVVVLRTNPEKRQYAAGGGRRTMTKKKRPRAMGRACLRRADVRAAR